MMNRKQVTGHTPRQKNVSVKCSSEAVPVSQICVSGLEERCRTGRSEVQNRFCYCSTTALRLFLFLFL